MKRELAGMTWEQLHQWEVDRRAEIRSVFDAGHLSIEQYRTLQAWVSDQCNHWLTAWQLNLLKEDE